jgi:hypothetical protein
LKISCIFVTWNSRDFIDDSIGRLHASMDPSEIVVVDNGSTDGTVELLKQRYPQVTVLALPVNTGFAGGNNFGIKFALAAGYDAVFLLNVDTIIDNDFITPCIQALEAHPEVGVIGPVVLEAYQDGIIQCEGGRIIPALGDFSYRNRGRKYVCADNLIDVGYVLGAAMMIRREVIERVGYFDEDYFPAYAEEADFCYRARRAGFRCVVQQQATIRHIGEQSSGGRQKAFNRISTHRFYFAIKHLGPASFTLASLLIVARVLYWKCRSFVRSLAVREG